MPKLADIWRLGELGKLDPGTSVARLYVTLKRLERVLSILHLRVEESAHLPGDPGGQVLYGGGSLELRGGTPGPPATTGQVQVEGSAFVFNEAGDDYDARFEGATDANLLVTNGGADRVGVGTANPLVKLHVDSAVDDSTSSQVRVSNSNAAGTSTSASLTALGDTASAALRSFGTANVGSRWGLTLGGYCELLVDAGNGLIVGTSNAKPVILGTNALERARIDSGGNVGINTTSFGTSAAKVLAIGAGTAPTTSPADQVALWVADAAAGDANLYSRNEVGEVNRLTGLTARNSAQFDKTSDVTLASVTGLTRNVEAGRSYEFTATLRTASDVASGVQVGIGGTATATSLAADALVFNAAAISAQGRSTALGLVVGVTAVTVALVLVWGVVVVNAGGTLTVTFAQNASSVVASSVLVNSSFTLRPIG